MEASNGQFFSLLPSNFIPLGLIMESDELNFLLEKLSKLRLLQIHDFFGWLSVEGMMMKWIGE